jgi:hypothetical protein
VPALAASVEDALGRGTVDPDMLPLSLVRSPAPANDSALLGEDDSLVTPWRGDEEVVEPKRGGLAKEARPVTDRVVAVLDNSRGQGYRVLDEPTPGQSHGRKSVGAPPARTDRAHGGGKGGRKRAASGETRPPPAVDADMRVEDFESVVPSDEDEHKGTAGREHSRSRRAPSGAGAGLGTGRGPKPPATTARSLTVKGAATQRTRRDQPPMGEPLSSPVANPVVTQRQKSMKTQKSFRTATGRVVDLVSQLSATIDTIRLDSSMRLGTASAEDRAELELRRRAPPNASGSSSSSGSDSSSGEDEPEAQVAPSAKTAPPFDSRTQRTRASTGPETRKQYGAETQLRRRRGNSAEVGELQVAEGREDSMYI